MGQNESSFKQTYEETVSQLSSVQLGEISRRFNELYAKAGGPKGHVVDREVFSKYFSLPVAVGDRLFDAFDEKKNGKISFEEFVCGLAVVLHGSFHERCMLLFRVFNLNEDEGISRTELTTMLSYILHSTHTILHTIGERDAAVMSGEDTHETVRRMVDAAFTNCDISNTGKLLPLEFEYWLKRNPKILDSLLSFKTKDCTLGPLIMSPSEQLLSVAQEPIPAPTEVPLVVTMKAASPTSFQIGDPPEVEASLTPSATETKNHSGSSDGEHDSSTEQEDVTTAPSHELDESLSQGPTDSLAFPSQDLGSAVAVASQEASHVPTEESTDQAGSIMLEESTLSIDMSCVARTASGDKLGSPVLPTTSLEEVAISEGEQENPPSSLLTTNKPLEKEGEAADETPPTYVAEDLEKVEEELEGIHLTPSISDSVPDVTIDLEEGVGLVFSDEELPTTVEPSVPVEDSRQPSEALIEVKEISEEIHTAWVPTPKTQELLTQPQPTKDPNYLTCPALVADVRMSDAVSDLLALHFPEAERKVQLTVEQVTMDAEGLRRLISSGCLRAALDLTARFLSAHGQGLGQAGQPTVHTHKTLQDYAAIILQMWSARIALLIQLGLFHEAERELVAFDELQNPDLYYQYHTHSYPGKTGSMVPFSLRLLHAQLPGYQSYPQLSLDRLCDLQTVCDQVLAELSHGRLPGLPHPLTSHDQQVAVQLWRRRLARVKCAMANTLTAVQDFQMAADLYNSLLELLPQQQVELQSVIGRLYLQLGDLKSAQTYFNKVIELCKEQEGQRNNMATIKVNEGLVNVFLSRWQIARECFEEALKCDPSNLAIQSNITVCTFYQGRLKEAIGEMERFLHSEPPATLQPGVFGNLAAAYELESGNSLVRKLAFVPLLAAHTGDSFSIASLNIR